MLIIKINLLYANRLLQTLDLPLECSSPLHKEKEDIQVKALPDTGATRSVIAASLIPTFAIDTKRKEVLLAANGNRLRCKGIASFYLHYKGRRTWIEAIVSQDVGDCFLISWHDLQNLNVIHKGFPDVIAKLAVDSLTAIKTEFEDVLSDSLPPTPMVGKPMKILRDDMKIVPRRVLTTKQTPVHLKEAADEHLQQILKDGIIEPVTEPTTWVSPGFFCAEA